jgi:hypothetical protein
MERMSSDFTCSPCVQLIADFIDDNASGIRRSDLFDGGETPGGVVVPPQRLDRPNAQS